MLIEIDPQGRVTLPLTVLNRAKITRKNYIKIDFDAIDDGDERIVIKPAALRCKMCGYEFGVHKVLNLHLYNVCDIKLKQYYDK